MSDADHKVNHDDRYLRQVEQLFTFRNPEHRHVVYNLSLMSIVDTKLIGFLLIFLFLDFETEIFLFFQNMY